MQSKGEERNYKRTEILDKYVIPESLQNDEVFRLVYDIELRVISMFDDRMTREQKILLQNSQIQEYPVFPDHHTIETVTSDTCEKIIQFLENENNREKQLQKYKNHTSSDANMWLVIFARYNTLFHLKNREDIYSEMKNVWTSKMGSYGTRFYEQVFEKIYDKFSGKKD
ncbi:hypothetical protein MK079_05070 [Candidatus Gracilibacteria bacterium]|nr:hypothetical protein [Candidatus Gracilibacteria bacterium]